MFKILNNLKQECRYIKQIEIDLKADYYSTRAFNPFN